MSQNKSELWWIINIDSPGWIKNKKATIHPINKKIKKYFKYTATVSLNHDEIKRSVKNN